MNFWRCFLVFVLAVSCGVVHAANVAVHGTVLILDDNGNNYEGAIGATVQMRDNTSVGMAADADGRFNLTVDKESDVLRVAYVGYKEEFVPASQCVNGCTIKLVQDSINLKAFDVIRCGDNIKSHLNNLATGCVAGNAELASTIQSLQNHCNNTKQLSDFDAVYAKVKDIDTTKCMVAPEPVVQPTVSVTPVPVLSHAQLIANSRRQITASVTWLEDFRAQLGQSVWKNADGGFNTSRLVSDSVAGVVLGTAGGLITSSVVKKNQIKNGFDDIHCTVGGQIVADYGDMLTIGIR